MLLYPAAANPYPSGVGGDPMVKLPVSQRKDPGFDSRDLLNYIIFLRLRATGGFVWA